MNKSFKLTTLCACVALLIVSCDSNRRIQASYESIGDHVLPMKYDFNSDGTVFYTGSAGYTDKGSYKIKGNQIKVAMSDGAWFVFEIQGDSISRTGGQFDNKKSVEKVIRFVRQ
jgi:hypothetical protein